MENVYVSIIIPAYNEEDRIEKTILAIDAHLKKQPYTWEILVVSDGSQDLTIPKVSQLAKRVNNLRWIARKENKGKGYSVKEGMIEAKGRIRLFTDADNSTDISHFDKMRPFFDKGYDVVICSRNKKDVDGAQQAVSQKWYKRILGMAGNLFIQFVAVPGIWDTQCGFKAFRDQAAKKIFPQTKITKWGFDIEILALVRAMNMEIGIIPANWINDPRSHVKMSAYITTMFEALKVWWWMKRGRYEL
ncbi:dolichyl-phosphate beta-glucosyltransferase [Patescibacteria group bacterium]